MSESISDFIERHGDEYVKYSDLVNCFTEYSKQLFELPLDSIFKTIEGYFNTFTDTVTIPESERINKVINQLDILRMDILFLKQVLFANYITSESQYNDWKKEFKKLNPEVNIDQI